MQDTSDVVRRLWALCSVLRDEGVTYHEYLNELTQLLFLKLAAELEVEDQIPPEYRWGALVGEAPEQSLVRYQDMLAILGESPEPSIRAIFQDTGTAVRSWRSLQRLIHGIDEVDWYRARQSGLGDVYEGLIEKSAQEARYGAGQYFTPRSLVDTLVATLAPGAADRVYDPAAGTGGFLVAAGLRSKEHSARRQPELFGTELVRDVYRMGLMNLMIHELSGNVSLGDSLSVDPTSINCTVCLTNPPFGVKGTLTEQQARLLDHATSNKQLAFLQHVYKSLAPSGRAAVIVPDNVLFESGTARAVRASLLDGFRLHTVLHLPTGIFYATGVRTSVLFFCADGTTDETWFFDLRNGNGTYGKKRQLGPGELASFSSAFGRDPLGTSRRSESERFRRLSRDELRQSGDRLDIAFRQESPGEASSPTELVEAVLEELLAAQSAAKGIQEILTSLEQKPDEAPKVTDSSNVGRK